MSIILPQYVVQSCEGVHTVPDAGSCLRPNHCILSDDAPPTLNCAAERRGLDVDRISINSHPWLFGDVST
jgi:hypothetical protein